jgi:2,3-bisphosphoglycerate-independent phosphoglycerate mutase
MKFAIIIPDGSADEPQESLHGKTPLESAHVPNMDSAAAAGVVGRANNTPASLQAGSDTANLSLLGYDPLKHFTGRAPLEAAAQGIELGPGDWALRCNLVTIEEQVMRDFTAGHISSEEAAALMQTLQERLGNERLQFCPGVSYRNLLVVRSGGAGCVPARPAPFSEDTRTAAPHDLTDQSVLDGYPRGPGGDLLTDLMSESVSLFAEHWVNVARRSAGKPPATNIWLWGQGSTPHLAPFEQLYGVRGAMITAVDLLRGIAKLIGWQRIDVPGATGYVDTDYAAKGRYAVEALKEFDLVCVHVEATDEASHEGNVTKKIQALEDIDRHIVGPVFEALRSYGDYRLLVSPDHPTPLRTKTHSHGFVPFAMTGTGIQPDTAQRFDDPTADESGLVFAEGWKLMGRFLSR